MAHKWFAKLNGTVFGVALVVTVLASAQYGISGFLISMAGSAVLTILTITSQIGSIAADLWAIRRNVESEA